MLRIIGLWLALSLPVAAQQDDRGFLVGLIEDSLSGAGRVVEIDGFEGLLSSRATLREMRISDGDGVWLILRNAVLDWNRAALLRGRLEINELSATGLEIKRPPLPEPSALPKAEAAPFSLPDLPVSVEIGTLSVDNLILGRPVLGQPAELQIAAALSLAGGGGAVDLRAQRRDGVLGEFILDADFDPASALLSLAFEAREAPGGLVASLAGLPGEPALELVMDGAGPLDDYAATLRLSSDGVPALSGRIATALTAGGAAAPRVFSARLDGDIAGLFLPAYRPFFGDRIALDVAGQRRSDGVLELERLLFETASTRLEGEIALAPGGVPQRLKLTGQVQPLAGADILLPLPGRETRIAAAEIRADFDTQSGDALTADLRIKGLDRDDIRAADLALSVDGALSLDGRAFSALAAEIALQASGLAPTDQGLAEALGDQVSLRSRLSAAPASPTRLEDIVLQGAGLQLGGTLRIDGLGDSFETGLDLELEADDFARFSTLSGLDLSGRGELALDGRVALGGFADLRLDGLFEGIETGVAQADPLLSGEIALSADVTRDESGTEIRAFRVEGPELELDLSGQLTEIASDLLLDARLREAALVVPQLSGPLRLDGSAQRRGQRWEAALDLTGPLASVAELDTTLTLPPPAQPTNPPELSLAFAARIGEPAQLDPRLSTPVTLDGTARNVAGGYQVEFVAGGPFAAEATIAGLVRPGPATLPELDLSVDLGLPDSAALSPQISGPLTLRGTITGDGAGIESDLTATGPFDASADILAQAELTQTGPPRLSADITAALPRSSTLSPALEGPLELALRLTGSGRDWEISADGTGPFDATSEIAARATLGENAALPALAATLRTRLPDSSRLAPALRGALDLRADIDGADRDWSLEIEADGPLGASATSTAEITLQQSGPPEIDARLAARLADLSRLIPELRGALTLDGRVQGAGESYAVALESRGPGRAAARIAVEARSGGQLDLKLDGAVPLALANPFLSPNSLDGQAAFDLSLNGPPTLSALSGQIGTTGARMLLPGAKIALQEITADVTLSGAAARIDLSAAASEGGRLRLRGPVDLQGRYPADLQLELQNFALVDPQLYRTAANGQLSIAGPLRGAARIAGQIDLRQVDIQIPSGGTGTAGELPAITHLGAAPAVNQTRARAGLDTQAQDGADQTARAGGAAYPLDIAVSAPNRIFVRGRGLDAELGGAVRITGTSRNLITSGQFDLARGRLDLLGRRFVLDEGTVALQGSPDPAIRFRATSPTEAGQAGILIEGRASAPRVRFFAEPEAPEDEVVAQLLFGRSIAQISPFQALQLASAVATLTGRGGEGLIGRLRGRFDLDDLDVTSSETGGTAVRAGKYLSDNLYTDIEVDSDGGSAVSLNLDISPSVTARGTVESDGDSKLGIFFERDY